MTLRPSHDTDDRAKGWEAFYPGTTNAGQRAPTFGDDGGEQPAGGKRIEAPGVRDAGSSSQPCAASSA